MQETILTSQEHDEIGEAIRTAELETSGEIYCVLAHSSDDYFYPAAFILTALILIISLPVALALKYWWYSVGPVFFVAAQLAALALALLLIRTSHRLRVALVPKRLRYRRAHANAQKQFLAHNIHVTENRTGVLVFVSLAERYVEIVADQQIDARVEQTVWNDTVAVLLDHAKTNRLSEGFIKAVGMVGAVLREHFPAGPDNPNEIVDRLTEI